MKTFLSLITLLALSLPAVGQRHVTKSFLGPSVASITVTNAIGLTNFYGQTYKTNIVGIIYTNTAGTKVTTAAGNTTPILGQVDLPVLRDNPLLSANYVTGVTNVMQDLAPANSTLTIRLVGGSGANTAVVFRFVPAPSGTFATTAAGDVWSVSITPNTTTAVTVDTPVPLYRWPGVKTLRLLDVTNPDTDASANVWILNCELNGFE